MWGGYLTVGGMEVANACRTETYVGTNSWFKPVYGCTDLNEVLDEPPYRTPILDDAPWLDEAEPQSGYFMGFYLLDATGIEDSSRSVTFTEATGDGGRPSRVRHSSKTVVFDGLLIGCNECATEYGMRWLRNVLLASPCGGGTRGSQSCAGANLCYFACEPCTEVKSEECFDDAALRTGRTLRKFAVTSGPSITSKSTTTDGSVVWRVTFTGVAGVPWEYGFERCIVEGFAPGVTAPYCPDVSAPYDSIGEDFSDLDPVTGVIKCTAPVYSPVYDPNCVPLAPPPPPVGDTIGCALPGTEWTRYRFAIPTDMVPIWTDMVPVMTLTTAQETRNIRIRFYSDPFGEGDPTQDPCSYCGDFLITYLPPNSTTRLDGATETVVVTQQSQPDRNGSSLVSAGDGGPFEWPLLSCGIGYTVTIDVPTNESVVPKVDFSLAPRAA